MEEDLDVEGACTCFAVRVELHLVWDLPAA